MMYEKKRYVVHILGNDYTIISDEKEGHVMASAQQVNACMIDILNKVPSADIQKVAVLAALRIASDLLHSQAQRQENESKIEMCIEKIEHALL
jgi:cell division protein ZapA (FtsZ GTPase activity inhibitor)